MLLPTTTAVANVANHPNALTISKSSGFPRVRDYLVQQALLDAAQQPGKKLYSSQWLLIGRFH
jgi:hypothetical protein